MRAAMCMGGDKERTWLCEGATAPLPQSLLVGVGCCRQTHGKKPCRLGETGARTDCRNACVSWLTAWAHMTVFACGRLCQH